MARATATLQVSVPAEQFRPQLPLPRGRGKPAPVIGPDGRYFPTMRAAAAATGIYPSLISARVIVGRHGWRYATIEEIRRHEAEADDEHATATLA